MTTTATRLDDSAVGTTSGPRPVSWDSGDACLYALAVGAGRDDLAYTADAVTGVEHRAQPTLATVLGVDLGVLDRAVAVDWTRLVHTDQQLALHRPLPPTGEGVATTTITQVWDKRRAAVVVATTELADRDGRPWATGRASLFVDGAGGWGGSRGPRSPRTSLDGEPDRLLTTSTRSDQALLYRLTGDRNPLHSDPAFAASAGFEQPILHGMCTFGITARLILAACLDDDPARFGAMQARFSSPVVPGDELSIEVHDTADGFAFRTLRGDGTPVLTHGLLTPS